MTITFLLFALMKIKLGYFLINPLITLTQLKSNLSLELNKKLLLKSLCKMGIDWFLT